jgi:Fungal rhodopsin domain
VRLSALKTATGLSDPTWNNTDAATWSYLELSTAILAACLPTLRPLAIKFIPGFISPSDKSPPNSNGYVRQGPANHSAWVSAKFSKTSETKNTVSNSTEAESTENLHDSMYNLQTLPSHKIAVEREYIVRTASAV